jgi:hypothetical protein
MKMKQRVLTFTTVAICCCAFLMFANTLQAQTPEEKLQNLSQVLGLTEQQKSQLLPVLKAEAPKLEQIKSNPSMSKRDKRKEMKSIHDQADPQVKAILTPTQYEQWKSIRKDEIEKAKDGGGL